MLVISRARLRSQLRILAGIALIGAAGRFLAGLGDRLAVSGPFVEVTSREALQRWIIWFTRQLERFMRGGDWG
ncbi:MAG TPA: hypothetical protein VLK32_06955 [Bacillota bacterium]|nr:hypothetical protein [Bacillota bacterium]